MKLSWTVLAALVALVAVTSSASIDKRTVPNEPELRGLWDDILKKLREAASAALDKVRASFQNIRDSFSKTNAKAKECLEKFKKEFEAAANSDELKNQQQYAAYVKEVGKNTANARNITEFEKYMKNLGDKLKNEGGKLKAFAQNVQAMAEARVKCTLEAIRDNNNGRGMTTASSLTEDASQGVADGTTSDSGRDTNTEDATGSGTESATNDETNSAIDSATESNANSDTDSATESVTVGDTSNDSVTDANTA